MDQEDSLVSVGIAKIYSLVFLGLLATFVYFGAQNLYFIVTDAWVAPISLSSTNEKVLLTYRRIYSDVEKIQTLKARLPLIESMIQSKQPLLAQLTDIEAKLNRSLAWISSDIRGVDELSNENLQLSANQERLSRKSRRAQLDALIMQEKILAEARGIADRALAEAKDEYSKGLLNRSDYEKEVLAAKQFRIQEAENRKRKIDTEYQMLADQNEIKKAQAQLRLKKMQSSSQLKAFNVGAKGGRSPASIGHSEISPQAVEFQSKLVKISMEILAIQENIKTLENEYQAAKSMIEVLERTTKEAQRDPYFKAFEKPIQLVFIPYSEISGVSEGDALVDCAWSLVLCRQVGTIKALIPGEVNENDPWGYTARGQYAEIELSNSTAIEKKVLRIRKAQR